MGKSEPGVHRSHDADDLGRLGYTHVCTYAVRDNGLESEH
jgi:hypothetical protein